MKTRRREQNCRVRSSLPPPPPLGLCVICVCLPKLAWSLQQHCLFQQRPCLCAENPRRQRAGRQAGGYGFKGRLRHQRRRVHKGRVLGTARLEIQLENATKGKSERERELSSRRWSCLYSIKDSGQGSASLGAIGLAVSFTITHHGHDASGLV